MIKGYIFQSEQLALQFCDTIHDSLKEEPNYNAERYAIPRKHPKRNEWFVPHLERYPMPDGWIEVEKGEWFPEVEI